MMLQYSQKILFFLFFLISPEIASARQEILVDKLTSGPYPIDWNITGKYNVKGKSYYMVVKHNKAYAYVGKQKHLPPLPFQLPQAKNFDYAGIPVWQKVKNGYLVGYNQGEWGGSLHWFSSDGKETYKISNDQVESFILRNKEILALTDGSGQGMPLGCLSKIVFKDGKWSILSYIQTKTISHSAITKGSDIYLVAQSGIFKIDSRDSIFQLLDKPIWGLTSIFNSSVVWCKNRLYVGMFDGVYRYDLQSGKQDWFAIK